MDFKSRLFKSFFIPGLVVEVILLLCLTLYLSIDSLQDIRVIKMFLGGPAMLKVGYILIPLELQVIYFLIVSVIYSVRIPTLYKNQREKFVSSTRYFLIYGDITLTALLLQIIILFSRLSKQDIEWYVNLPVVILVFAFGCGMCAFFVYWTTALYKQYRIKFFGKETLKSIGLSIVWTLEITISIVALLLLSTWILNY